MEINQSIKILILGDRKVGKTSLVRKYLDKGFRAKYMATIGTEISTKNYIFDMNKYPKKVKYNSEKLIFTLQILDFASNQIENLIKRDRLISSFTAICFVFDVSRYETYINISHLIVKINEKYPKMKIPILIVGNQSDNKNRTLSDDDIMHYINTLKNDKRIRSKFIEYRIISVKDDNNVSEIFTVLADEVIKLIPFRKGKFISK